METFKLRILVQHVEGADIAILYTRDAFNELKIEKESIDNSCFISVGQVLTIYENRYIVDHFSFKMYENLIEVGNKQYGMPSMSRIGEKADYNCQLGVFVKKI